MKLMILNGPNINLTGLREQSVYGSQSWADIEAMLKKEGEKRGHELTLRQSNHEGVLVDWIQQAFFEKYDGIIINPGAYTHYSYAIHDALSSITVPAIEVHMSNIHQREEFRHHSVTADACKGQIVGLGAYGYVLAMDALAQMKK